MKKRGQWGSNFGFLLAAVGSAVGLGNIWGFPYKMGENGGFSFLFVYLVLVVLVGFAIMLGELTLGRKTGKGVVGTYKELSKKYKWLGWFGILSAFLIMTFYSVLGAYCIKYAIANVGNIFGASFGTNGMDATTFFTEFLTNPVEAVILTALFMIVTCVIVIGGISGGIEKFAKIAMPALFIMLIVVIVRSVTLPGASEGIAFMFSWDFTPLIEDPIGVLSAAGGQMFFSLSLGMGAMITFGSYLGKFESLEKNSVIIPIADTIIALMAGLAVLPAAFALGGSDATMQGPMLLYVTLQNVFDSMGVIGPFFGFLFYLLVIIAAITSSISLVEVITTYFVDKAEAAHKDVKVARRKYAIIASVAIMALAAIVAWDGLGSNGLVMPFGYVWLDFFDLISEGILMPLGALIMSIFIGWEMDKADFNSEVEAEGNKFKSKGYFHFVIKWIVPLAMLFILLGQLQSFGIINIF